MKPTHHVDDNPRKPLLDLHLRSLQHVGIPVRNMIETVRFWSGALSIPLAAKQPVGEHVCWLEIERFQFHLFQRSDGTPGPVPCSPGDEHGPATPTLFFSTPFPLAHTALLLAARDVPSIPATLQFDGPTPALLVQDPNGYWLALVHDCSSTAAADKLFPLPYPERTPLVDFLGISLPVVDRAEALRQFQDDFHLGGCSASLTAPRGSGVFVGAGRKVVFIEDPVAARRFGSFHGTPPREFHLNFTVTSADAARAALVAADLAPEEDAVRFRGGGGACQLFMRSEATHMIIEISERVANPHITCRTLRPDKTLGEKAALLPEDRR